MSINIVQVPSPDQETFWASKDYGIRSRREFERHADRSYLEIVTDVVAVNSRGFGYVVGAGAKRYDAYTNSVTFPKFNDPEPIGTAGKADTLGLAVFFHGLNGQPSLWDYHLHQMEVHPQIDLYVPEVPEEGHLSLTHETSNVLLGRIVDWTKGNPGKPVALFGQSNGTRFALLFEIWLREHAPKTPVHVSLTAGVLYGTTTVDLANALLRTNENPSISFGKLSKVNCEELAFGSDTARKLVADARKPLPAGVAARDYAMYSPMHDVHVPDTGSGLPILVPDGQASKKERHYIVSNYGHNAIVTALAEVQIKDCVEWMKRNVG